MVYHRFLYAENSVFCVVPELCLENLVEDRNHEYFDIPKLAGF
jgi:hypothetical protein